MGDDNEEMLEDMKDCYSIFDRKGDMKVEDTKIIDVLRSLGLNPLTADVEKCLKESNLVGTRVDFETFYGIYKQLFTQPTVGSYDDMVEGLKTFDRDSTGSVSAAELRHILMNLADKMTEEQTEAIIVPLEDANGYVNYDHLIKHAMSG
eukprot:gene5677-6373_t